MTTFDISNYENLQRYKRTFNELLNAHQMSHKDRLEFLKDNAIRLDISKEFRERYGEDYTNTFINFLSARRMNIRISRKILKQDHTPTLFKSSILHRASYNSKTKGLYELTEAFPSQQFKIHITKKLMDVDVLSNEWQGKYSGVHEVWLPITWHKTVYENDLCTVQTGKRKAFVLFVHPVFTSFTEIDEIKRYFCSVMTIYNDEAEVHKGYMLCYGQGVNKVSAFATEYEKAYSLFKRRMNKEVAAALIS